MAEPLKNSYDEPYIRRLSAEFSRHDNSFAKESFVAAVLDGSWPDRELKDRMYHIASCLQSFLPQDYPRALDRLLRAAPPFGGFEGMLFPAFVECYGLDHWDLSLPALAHLTKLSTSEFAVRPFIQRDPIRMMAQMARWAEDPNHHVRRLASEGCRPRLPWASALPEFKRDPAPILPILERLKDDPELYVRRSVANNLNDIAKDHPELVLETCSRWIGQSEGTDWVVKHACRTLLKRGTVRALRLFGFSEPAGVFVDDLEVEGAPVAIGSSIQFRFALRVEQARKLRIEYAVDFVKSNGSTSRKIFQVAERETEAGVSEYRKAHSFRDLSTRKHYPGAHRLTIVVNGVEKSRLEFAVTD